MLGFTSESLPESGVRIVLHRADRPLSYAEVLLGWQNDAEFRRLFMEILRDCPYAAFRWETPPVTTATMGRCFEFVLLNDRSLDRAADPAAFSQYFHPARPQAVVEFLNLGHDALLVVPGQVGSISVYAYLANFCRQAPISQQHALWAAVGAAMQRQISSKPIWLNTAGDGVPWLHIRLDNRPKYYHHAAYC